MHVMHVQTAANTQQKELKCARTAVCSGSHVDSAVWRYHDHRNENTSPPNFTLELITATPSLAAATWDCAHGGTKEAEVFPHTLHEKW
jgi:hypothetical protein